MNEDVSQDDKLQKECCKALELLQCGIQGPYWCGNDFTLADVHVVPFVMRWLAQLKHVKGFNVRADANLRHLCNWYDACCTRPSVQKATIDEETIVRVHHEKVAFLKASSKT